MFGPPHCQYQKEKLLQPTLRFHGPGAMLVGCNSFSFSVLKMGRTGEIHYPVIPQNGGHLIEVQLLYQGKPLRAILALFLGSRRGLR